MAIISLHLSIIRILLSNLFFTHDQKQIAQNASSLYFAECTMPAPV